MCCAKFDFVLKVFPLPGHPSLVHVSEDPPADLLCPCAEVGRTRLEDDSSEYSSSDTNSSAKTPAAE